MVLLLDCTIRDGGNCNEWDFSLETVKECYRAVSESQFDYFEIGHLCTRERDFIPTRGVWADLDDDIIAEVADSFNGCKLSALIRAEHMQRLRHKIKHISLVRITLTPTKEYNYSLYLREINRLNDLGYELTLNLTFVEDWSELQVKEISDLFNNKVKCLYLADSTGHVLFSKVESLITLVKKYWTGSIGLHPHNNQDAISKSLKAIELGIDMLDSSIQGYGRGPGNLYSEQIGLYLNKPIDSLISVGKKYIFPLRQKEDWVPYMICSFFNTDYDYSTYWNTDENNMSLSEFQNKINKKQ